jgi:uncharacterized protein YlxP (DUF503 family)
MRLRLPQAHSLKEKRSVVRPILDGSRSRFAVASAEVGEQASWHFTLLAFATVAGSAAHVKEVLSSVERFVWSFPEAEVVASDWLWWGE